MQSTRNKAGNFHIDSDKDSKTKNDDSKNECEVNALFKSPGLLKLNGQLLHTNGVQIFGKIRPQLMELKNKHGDQNLVPFLQRKFDQRKGPFDDLALLECHIGYFVTSSITKNNSVSQKHYKSMETQIQKCKLQNPNIIEGLLCYNICLSYILQGKKKLGKADKYLQKAKQTMQFNSPCTYTSYICHIEAQISVMSVQFNLPRNKKRRRKICKDAASLYEEAIYHWNAQSANDDLFYPIYYLVQKIYINLDMPTVYAMISYQYSSWHVVLECGRLGTPLPEDVEEAEQILFIVKEKSKELTQRHHATVREWVALADTYINLRKTQISIQSGEDDLESLGIYFKAKNAYEHYCELNNNSFALTYEWKKRLLADFKTILNEIEVTLIKSPLHLGFDEDTNSLSSDVL